MADKGRRSYIAIDLKSFYASVECKERELDPMTTNLVVADKSRTEKTICLAEYAVAQHIPYREDSSNRSTKYLRNKIRLGLVPRIKEISPKFTDLMRQNIGRLTDAQLFINHGIQRIREEVITTENGIDTIHIDRIDRAFPLNFVIFELLNST